MPISNGLNVERKKKVCLIFHFNKKKNVLKNELETCCFGFVVVIRQKTEFFITVAHLPTGEFLFLPTSIFSNSFITIVATVLPLSEYLISLFSTLQITKQNGIGCKWSCARNDKESKRIDQIVRVSSNWIFPYKMTLKSWK